MFYPGYNMFESGCNMLDMSGCNLLEQAATCPGATRSNSWHHVLLQHARSGCNFMLHFVTANCFYGFDIFLVALPAKLKMF
jgi:hypothetical protein